MKPKSILLLAAMVLTLGLVSCSQCYECTYEVEIENNGQTTTETVTDDVCTSDGQEIEDREANDQTCIAV